MSRPSLLYVVSFGVHAALAVGVLAIKGPKIYEDVSVAVFEKSKPEPPKPAPPPPPEPPGEAPKAPAAKAKSAAPKPAEAKLPEAPAPEAAAGAGSDIPDFGLSLSGGTGGGGLAVPSGPKVAAAPAASTQVTKKVLAAAPKPALDDCTETPVKPKVKSLPTAAYTAEAREAGIAGKVRVELTVDASGNVTGARVLAGLGHGLDESALAAARAATFEPGTRCGKAASATFVIAMRFAL